MSWIKDETIQSKPNQLMNIFNPYIRESIQDEKKSILPVHLFKNKGKKPSQIIYDEVNGELIAYRFIRKSLNLGMLRDFVRDQHYMN